MKHISELIITGEDDDGERARRQLVPALKYRYYINNGKS